jgi:hypothetical protein
VLGACRAEGLVCGASRGEQRALGACRAEGPARWAALERPDRKPARLPAASMRPSSDCGGLGDDAGAQRGPRLVVAVVASWLWVFLTQLMIPHRAGS